MITDSNIISHSKRRMMATDSKSPIKVGIS